MSTPVNLTVRQQQILWATIRHYIATAEPVGSKALVDEYNLSVSPATIRHSMGVLEKVGLLYQPYTSAGRVPSDSGYRLYVDQLVLPTEKITSQVEKLLGDELNWQKWSLESLLRGAAQILSKISGYIVLITMPQADDASIRHLQLVQVASGRIMVVIVTDRYETQSLLMGLPQSSPYPDGRLTEEEQIDQELQLLSSFLTHQLRGKTLSQLPTLDFSELDREFERYGDFLRKITIELSRLHQPAQTQMMVSGVSEVLRHPEFAELQQVQMLMRLLETEQNQLLPLIFEYPHQNPNRVRIRIGSENPLERMRACTLVSATYQRGLIPVGSVGMLGPTRMMYENAIALVSATADYLSDMIR